MYTRLKNTLEKTGFFCYHYLPSGGDVYRAAAPPPRQMPRGPDKEGGKHT